MKPTTLRIITNEDCPITNFFDKNMWEVLIDEGTQTVTLIKRNLTTISTVENSPGIDNYPPPPPNSALVFVGEIREII